MAQARGRKPLLLWSRSTAYHLWPLTGQPTSIVALGDRRAPYAVTGRDDLPAHLARVNRSRTRDGERRIEEQGRALLGFVENFGLLGYSALGGGHRKLPDLRHPGDRQKSAFQHLVEHDDLAWALDHAENLDWILTLLGELRRRGRLRHVLDRLADVQAGHAVQIATVTPPWRTTLVLTGDDGEPVDIQRARRNNTDEVLARKVIAAILNPVLEAIPRRYDPATGLTGFRLRSLIEATYQLVADSIGGRVKQCRCGAYFVAGDPRQSFCPPPPDVRESRCAKRFNQRLRRSKEGGRKR